MKKLAVLSIAMIVLMGLSLLALPMPSEARLTPEIFVSPPKKKFFAPCNVSNTLDIEIKIFNEFEDTGAEIYAVDFKLLWNTTLLKLVEIHIKPPYDDTTKYFIIKNTTGVIPAWVGPTPNHEEPWGWSDCWDYYWLAFTALDTTPGIKDKVAIVNLKFHIEKEPCWPDVLLSPLFLYDVTMSGPCGQPLPYGFTVEHGDFYIASTKPDMTITPAEIINDCQCKYFDISVSISNLANGYGFGFKITFNSTLLEANVQCVKILFPQPFEYQYLEIGAGYVIVNVSRPCIKPPLACGDMVVVTICLHAIWPKEVIPHKWNDKIAFEWAYVMTKCPGTRVYNFPAGPPDPVLSEELNVFNATYYWRPKREDLNVDCHVDIIDLGAIAAKYGSHHAWSYLSVTGSEDVVDLYDVVAVAKMFCKKVTPTK